MKNNPDNQPRAGFETDNQKQNQVVNEQEQNRAVNGDRTIENTQATGNSASNNEDEESGDSEIETPQKKEGGSAEKTIKKIPNL